MLSLSAEGKMREGGNGTVQEPGRIKKEKGVPMGRDSSAQGKQKQKAVRGSEGCAEWQEWS